MAMQYKTISKNTSLTILNKKNTSKIVKPVKDKEEEKQNSKRESLSYHKHVAEQYIRGTKTTTLEYKKFVTLLYKGLFYAVNNLKGPSQQYINKKKVKLPEPTQSKKKILMMDLDETLIHSIYTNEKTDVKFTKNGDEFKFNVRPFCRQFLLTMSHYYNVYVFTAGTQDYAEPIVSYLNQQKKTIHGVLHRKNCMETQNGFFIKDLRIIENRELKDIIIVDNLVYSFGLQLTNGIPVLQFIDNKNDRELVNLSKFLKQMSQLADVRPYLQQKLKLKNCLNIDEQQFLTVEEGLWKV